MNRFTLAYLYAQSGVVAAAIGDDPHWLYVCWIIAIPFAVREFLALGDGTRRSPLPRCEVRK